MEISRTTPSKSVISWQVTAVSITELCMYTAQHRSINISAYDAVVCRPQLPGTTTIFTLFSHTSTMRGFNPGARGLRALSEMEEVISERESHGVAMSLRQVEEKRLCRLLGLSTTIMRQM
jgi:hypothetical protein